MSSIECCVWRSDHLLLQIDCLASEPQGSTFPSTGVTDAYCTFGFQMHAEDLNSGPEACIAGSRSPFAVGV